MQLLGEEGTQKTSVDQYPALTDSQFLNCEFIVGLDMTRIGASSVVVSSLNPLVKMILNGSGSVVGGSSSIVWEDFDPVGVRCVLEGLVHCGYREVNVPTHCFEATRMFLDYIGETRKQLN